MLGFDPEFDATFLMDKLHNNSVKSLKLLGALHFLFVWLFSLGWGSLGLVPKDILSIKKGALGYCINAP